VSPILGLDWGEKRIGVAFSEGVLASPHSVIERKTRQADYARIAALVAETGAERVVLGLPQSLNGDQPLGPQARRVLRHYRALVRHLSVPVELADERYSTVDAAEHLAQAGRRGKTSIDAAAAAVILQAYLDRRQISDG
jgi:putative Holliday junction resolvase